LSEYYMETVYQRLWEKAQNAVFGAKCMNWGHHARRTSQDHWKSLTFYAELGRLEILNLTCLSWQLPAMQTMNSWTIPQTYYLLWGNIWTLCEKHQQHRLQ
jgi:hypothetical protein